MRKKTSNNITMEEESKLLLKQWVKEDRLLKVILNNLKKIVIKAN